MSFPDKYNPADAQDILRYAKWLLGKSFYDVLAADVNEVISPKPVDGFSDTMERTHILEETAADYGNAQRKGGLGNLIEKHFFHYDPNSNPEADFSLAGLELKVTPYEERTGRGKGKGITYYVAGERLVLTMIDFNQRPIEFDFFKSHVWEKCRQILLIYYLRNKSLGDNLKYRINYVGIFTPNATDLIIIRQDYLLIMEKISNGKAHEISESDTMYLGACTKGSTAAKSIVIQIENNVPAQKRAFCFKTSYMTTVLNEYFINAQENQETVVSDADLLANLGFEGYLQSKISKYVGKSDRELCHILGLDYSGNKAQWINIAFAMLGIKSNKAEEFQKANIVVKATRIEENGSIRENTSFPPFKFMDLVNEKWIDSDEDDEVDSEELLPDSVRPSKLQAYFASTKFLFVVFKKQGTDYILKGCQLWNMPYSDLNDTVREGWEQIRDTIIRGVKFDILPVKNGYGKPRIMNNLPKKDSNPIIHIRPHAQKAYYKIDGYEDGNPSDGNMLPDGRWMTTQCFWLNNTYVMSILRDDLK